jgi:hypothetical protein
MLANDLITLRDVVARGGNALEIDGALLPLFAHSDPSIIAPILLLLNENGDQDGMWSMLHTAESFEGAAYIAGLLRALPELAQSCPEWAKIVMIRTINSDAYRVELVRQLSEAKTPAREAAATICERINEDARFHSKTWPVLAVAVK